jgi:hypothetical protein
MEGPLWNDTCFFSITIGRLSRTGKLLTCGLLKVYSIVGSHGRWADSDQEGELGKVDEAFRY